MAYNSGQGAKGAVAGAEIGTQILPGIGTAIGTVLGSLSGFLGSGTAHGPGSESRAKHLSAFERDIAKSDFKTQTAALDRYLAKNKNCTRASDPGSCKQLVEVWTAGISHLHSLEDAPTNGATSLAPTELSPARDAKNVPTDPRQSAGFVDDVLLLPQSASGDVFPILLAVGAAFYFWGK